MCVVPPSFTGMIDEIVPRVWPGVTYIVIVVSPSVSFCPSVATTSRVGLAKLTFARSIRSQSGRRHDDVGAAFLQEPRAADVVAVRVADDHVLDLLRIEPERGQPVDDLVLDRVVEDRVHHDDAVRGRDGPRRVLGLADEVEVVEHLDRLGVPRGARGRAGRSRGAAPAARGNHGLGPDVAARGVEDVGEVFASGSSGLGEVLVNSALLRDRRRTEQKRETDGRRPCDDSGPHAALRGTR